MAEYDKPFAATESINVKDHLNLTLREHEIFTLLMEGVPPKEISYTLKVANSTVHFHIGNLYKKLGVHTVNELLVKYGMKK